MTSPFRKVLRWTTLLLMNTVAWERTRQGSRRLLTGKEDEVTLSLNKWLKLLVIFLIKEMDLILML